MKFWKSLGTGGVVHKVCRGVHVSVAESSPSVSRLYRGIVSV
jgi:hypothetical protein